MVDAFLLNLVSLNAYVLILSIKMPECFAVSQVPLAAVRDKFPEIKNCAG
jgi:hypothetical protein